MPGDVPTTGLNVGYKGEKPPVMPVVATDHTAAGAQAFAAFFVDTIDWGYVTTSSAYMRHYYLKACTRCADLANSIDDTAAVHHHYLGNRISVSSVRSDGSASPLNDQFVFTATTNLTAFTSVDASGKIYAADVPHNNVKFKIAVSWQSNAWRMLSFDPIQ